MFNNNYCSCGDCCCTECWPAAFCADSQNDVICCMIFCIIKAVLLIAVTVFVLFMPLGDPNVVCPSLDSSNNTFCTKTMSLICGGYFLVTEAPLKAIQALQYISGLIVDLVHQGILQLADLIKCINNLEGHPNKNVDVGDTSNEKSDENLKPEKPPKNKESNSFMKLLKKMELKKCSSTTTPKSCAKCVKKGVQCGKECPKAYQQK